MRGLLALGLGAGLALVLTMSAAAGASKTGGFLNYSLAETTGTSCPGSQTCSNIAAEPAIRADGAGRFFGSSENGLGGGTVAFRSVDNGLHYTTLVSPNGVWMRCSVGSSTKRPDSPFGQKP